MNKEKLQQSIDFFAGVINDLDETMQVCGPEARRVYVVQRMHYENALDAIRKQLEREDEK